MTRGVDGPKVRLWRERFFRFDDGGMKVEDFCLAEGISQSSFYNWRWKLAQRKRPSSPTRKRQERKTERGAFEPVTIAAAAMVVIRLPGDILIEVPANSEHALRAVVGQLAAVGIETDRC